MTRECVGVCRQFKDTGTPLQQVMWRQELLPRLCRSGQHHHGHCTSCLPLRSAPLTLSLLALMQKPLHRRCAHRDMRDLLSRTCKAQWAVPSSCVVWLSIRRQVKVRVIARGSSWLDRRKLVGGATSIMLESHTPCRV
jgi:hypothetical protein